MILILSLAVLSGCTEVILVPHRTPAPAHDNGKHKGWYKNRHNPHNPASDNPGHNRKFAVELPAVDHSR